MKSKFVDIEAEAISESAISSIQSNFQPQNGFIFQPRQQPLFIHRHSTFISNNNVQQKVERKPISVFLFAMFSVSFIVLAFQEIPEFFIPRCDGKTNFTLFSLLINTLVMLSTSIYLVGWKQMFFLYFLLDTVLLTLIVSMIGLIGMVSQFQIRTPQLAYICQYLGPISSFCIAGTYRILIKHANFKRWQNIIFKLSILANGICYFMIGIYTMYTNFSLSSGTMPQFDTQFRDFSLLFVFGGLSFFKQLINLHNRFDRTSKLNYNYKLTDQIEEQTDDKDNQGTQTEMVMGIQSNNQQHEKHTQHPQMQTVRNHNELQHYFQKRISEQNKRTPSMQDKNKNQILNQN